MPELNSDKWISITEAKEITQTSRRTIYTWYRAGKLITMRTPGGALRIKASCLLVKDEGKRNANSAST
jgi:excisionase family DNA binding protein